MHQTSFADHKKRQTCRELFLTEMEKAVPWALLLEQLAAGRMVKRVPRHIWP